MTGRFKLLVSEAWRSLGANLSTTIAATMTVLIGMFLLGLFIALGTWTVSWSNHVKRELVVKVYFLPNATAKQENLVARQLQQNRYVKPGGLHYVSKEQGFAEMKRKYPTLTQNVPSNPLGDRLELNPLRGGDVNVATGEFAFNAAEAYLIENGELTRRLAGVSLLGNGPEALLAIDAVCTDVGFTQALCGKDDQWIPVSYGAPTLRISRLTVAGHG